MLSLLLIVLPILLIFIALYLYIYKSNIVDWLQLSSTKIILQFQTILILMSIIGLLLAIFQQVDYYLIWTVIILAIMSLLAFFVASKIK